MARASTQRRDPGQQTIRSGAPTSWRHQIAKHKVLWGTSALAVAAVAAAAAALWPRHPGPTPPPPVSTVSQNERACLLSDHGQPASATVFADLQHAAASHGSVNLQQTTLPAQATDAAPELAALIQQHCAVIFTLGPISTMAARAAATNTHSNGTSLVAITDSAIGRRSLTTLPLTGLTADRITSALQQALN